MVAFTSLASSLVLAGLAQATVTSVVYITKYETNCNACTSSSNALVVVAPSPVAQAVVTQKTTSSVVPTGTVVVAAAAPSSSSTTPTTSSSSSTSRSSTVTRAVVPSSSTGTGIVAAAPVTLAVAPPTSSTIAACPATAHVDALGSKNYPRIITPVSSTNPSKIYGPQYFASIGGGNSTIFTFDYQTAGTCTLEFKFPSMAQIVALQGTTSYTLSGASINATLYQLASVAPENASFQTKPARGAAYPIVLTPASNTTITSFACPVGTSVSYELVATDSNTLSWFEGMSYHSLYLS